MAESKARDYILNGKQIIEEKPDFNNAYSATTTNILYKDVDNDGDTYYYRGAPTDNYFKLGKTPEGLDIWWRIIRINGDNTIRLVYQGVGDSKDINGINDNTYYKYNLDLIESSVGFQYTYGEEKGHTTNSNALNVLNEWFEKCLLNELKLGYIDKNAGFWCDRSHKLDSTYYDSMSRLYYTDKVTPTFIVDDIENDLFTYEEANQGTKSLKYPIGLITVDEAYYAGVLTGVWENTYISNSPTWFITPGASAIDGQAQVWNNSVLWPPFPMDITNENTSLSPVINISGSVNLMGGGTAENPYVITEPVIHHNLLKNGKIIEGIYKNGKKLLGIAHAGEVIWKYEEPIPEIKPFATCTDEELKQYLDLHYKGRINIPDYWKVGDTRVMHLSAMPSETSASESHVEQDITMVIIGINHDNLKEAINGKTKAVITLQCKELLGNNGTTEKGYIYGSSVSTSNSDNYSNNPRRTWLNGTFVNSLPSTIQPLVKTVIKKNINNHSSSPSAGPNTEDKAFLTSYPEMFGSASYSVYKGSVALEGEQYAYYNSNERRIKYPNNNGTTGNSAYEYWLRSPSSNSADSWMIVYTSGKANISFSRGTEGLAPAFCL